MFFRPKENAKNRIFLGINAKKTPKIEDPAILFWPKTIISAPLTDLNESSLESPFTPLQDG